MRFGSLMTRVRAVMSQRATAGEQEWIEIVVPVAEHDQVEIAGMLAARGDASTAGVEMRPDGIVWWVPTADAAHALAETRARVARFEAAGAPVRAAAVRLGGRVAEAEWRDAWKRHFGTTRVTERIVLVPSWESYAPRPGDVVIDIDPGRAFGTGAHATTRLCLAELERIATTDTANRVARVLDCGTGSGILAIAAAKLWPQAAITAVDVDAEAIEVAAENCARNAVSARVTRSVGSAAAATGVFDLVVANIERAPLLALRESLSARLASGGILVLSGLLAEEADAVAAAYLDADQRLERVRITRDGADPDWSAVVLCAR
jgi:ribosomal protein L11 methyltransferase